MDYLTTDPRVQDLQTMFLTKHMHHTFHATPTSPQKILHIACGTGFLTNLLAKRYPTAQVIGISTKSVDASLHGRLPNLMYIKASLEELVEREDMLFWPGTFDYIFQRGGHLSVEEGWDRYVRVLVGLLGEGGWIEVQQGGWGVFAGSGREGVEEGGNLSEGWEWMKEVERGSKGTGIDVKCGEKLAGWMRRAGLVGVEKTVYKVPIEGPLVDGDGNESATRLRRTIEVHRDLVEKFCPKNKSAEALSELNDNVAETYSKCIQGDYMRMHVATGQKSSR
ncbi:hypothetical protein DOTSEDRAFT_49617 [Dothistroma septosporum NZE10]|uniref:Uncharacterized protein n=1 Tax=Dothistroma septosporum (strain NZE10 / CBS 128990) TaxID=675120 RepID=N1Q3T0_DOTSN|nr:hypothetical protein DOTSEDRAFT_49617 [Dothistroma septosporum NZE10]